VTVDQRPARALSDQGSWGRHEPEQGETWNRAEHFIAFAGTVLIAMRVELTGQLLTLGDLLVAATFPLWFPRAGSYIAARAWLFVGLLCLPVGLVLTVLNAVDHQIRLGTSATSSVLMISLLFSVGFMLWAREKLSSGGLVASYGLGLFMGISDSTALYSTNPWKFGFALPVTILVLGLAELSKRRWLELTVVVILCIVSSLTDTRSAFAMFLVAGSLIVWQMRPRVRSRRGSAFRAVIGIMIVAVVVYNLGQALILEGVLGEQTQQRTAEQIGKSGNLILGGRPEIAATVNLMRVHPLGFGSGTIPNYNDIRAAKQGMAFIGYDPNNGYVERWMFSHGYALHSGFGDFWAIYGPIGLIFTFFMLILVLRKLGTALSSRTASGALIFVSALTVWNIFFAPSYSGLKMLILALALSFMPRPPPPRDPLTRPRRRYRPL
jgi:hypothetical protein